MQGSHPQRALPCPRWPQTHTHTASPGPAASPEGMFVAADGRILGLDRCVTELTHRYRVTRSSFTALATTDLSIVSLALSRVSCCCNHTVTLDFNLKFSAVSKGEQIHIPEVFFPKLHLAAFLLLLCIRGAARQKRRFFRG